MIAIRSLMRFGLVMGCLFSLMPGPVLQAAQNNLFNEAQVAFSAGNFDLAMHKIRQLPVVQGVNEDAPLELLCYNIGLANSSREKYPQAEDAFSECIKRFPKGEYTSRAYLGLGRARMVQNAQEKKQGAIEALKLAATDPKYRFGAEMWLGQIYTELKKPEEALAVFRNLTGSDVSTFQQATAAVEVIDLLAEHGRLEDLSAYLGNLARQPGVRDAIAWFANQGVVRADELVGKQAYDPALAIYRSVPPRTEILETQANALEVMRRDLRRLEARVKAEEGKPMNERSDASQLLSSLKPAVELAEMAQKAIEEKPDLDAALLMRRGRCLFYLDRFEEALVCFETIRTKYPEAKDAEKAAYAEIVILNKRKDLDKIKDRSQAFIRQYPHSQYSETVATIPIEHFMARGDWKEVGMRYRELEKTMPQSESLDRFVFFQGLAFFQDTDFAKSTPLFERVIKDFPNSPLVENSTYYVAMARFLSNDYKETVTAATEYLKKFPNGRYAGELQQRLAFIAINDKKVDQSDKIIRDLSGFISEHPDDPANGSLLCLIGDTYEKKAASDKEPKVNGDKALDAYIKALWTDSPDDVIQYALDSATNLLKARKDWGALAELRAEFLKRKPDSQIALPLRINAEKHKKHGDGGSRVAEFLTEALKPLIADPAKEQAEYLIDELVKTLVPGKNAKVPDAGELDKQLVGILDKTMVGQENATTSFRTFYARARLAQLLKRKDLADLYLKNLALNGAKDSSALSPRLLEICGDILLKAGDLDGAEAMFKRLRDHFPDALNHDAGAVGLGCVALGRKKPDAALKIFGNNMAANPGISVFQKASLGKLQALMDLDELEPAEKLAEEIISDRKCRGETAGKAYLQLARIYRKQAAKAEGEQSRGLLKKAHAIYIRVFIMFKGYPDISAEGIWEASEIAKELGDEELRQKNLKDLLAEPKLRDNEFFKKVEKEMENDQLRE